MARMTMVRCSVVCIFVVLIALAVFSGIAALSADGNSDEYESAGTLVDSSGATPRSKIEKDDYYHARKLSSSSEFQTKDAKNDIVYGNTHGEPERTAETGDYIAGYDAIRTKTNESDSGSKKVTSSGNARSKGGKGNKKQPKNNKNNPFLKFKKPKKPSPKQNGDPPTKNQKNKVPKSKRGKKIKKKFPDSPSPPQQPNVVRESFLCRPEKPTLLSGLTTIIADQTASTRRKKRLLLQRSTFPPTATTTKFDARDAGDADVLSSTNPPGTDPPGSSPHDAATPITSPTGAAPTSTDPIGTNPPSIDTPQTDQSPNTGNDTPDNDIPPLTDFPNDPLPIQSIVVGSEFIMTGSMVDSVDATVTDSTRHFSTICTVLEGDITNDRPPAIVVTKQRCEFDLCDGIGENGEPDCVYMRFSGLLAVGVDLITNDQSTQVPPFKATITGGSGRYLLATGEAKVSQLNNLIIIQLATIPARLDLLGALWD